MSTSVQNVLVLGWGSRWSSWEGSERTALTENRLRSREMWLFMEVVVSRHFIVQRKELRKWVMKLFPSCRRKGPLYLSWIIMLLYFCDYRNGTTRLYRDGLTDWVVSEYGASMQWKFCMEWSEKIQNMPTEKFMHSSVVPLKGTRGNCEEQRKCSLCPS